MGSAVLNVLFQALNWFLVLIMGIFDPLLVNFLADFDYQTTFGSLITVTNTYIIPCCAWFFQLLPPMTTEVILLYFSVIIAFFFISVSLHFVLLPFKLLKKFAPFA